MKRSSKILIRLFPVLILLTVCFIWSNSLDIAAESSSKSGFVLKLLLPLLEPILGPGNVTEHLIRKLAHFSEFCALGCELSLFAALRNRRGLQPAANCGFVVLAAAVADETIQIFSAGRSSSTLDVLLDFSGGVTGIVLIFCLWALCRHLKNRKS